MTSGLGASILGGRAAMRLICCALGLGIVAALATSCNKTEHTKVEGTSWVVSEQPILVIADSSNPPGHEFNGISSARRRHDRSILLANAGAVELALYDSAGRFQRAVGRKGQGPGEFQGPIQVFAWRADSLVVYDPAILRWTFLDTALTATRTVQVPSSDLLQPTWLYKGAMVIDGVTDPVPTWILSVLDSVRQKDPGYRRLVRAWHDDVGALWVRDSIDDRRWAVYTEAGPTTASVTLPPHVEPLEIGEDFVLGGVKDSLGVEEIRLHSLLRSKLNTGTPDPTPTRVPSERAMMQTFRDLLMAQEVYY